MFSRDQRCKFKFGRETQKVEPLVSFLTRSFSIIDYRMHPAATVEQTNLRSTSIRVKEDPCSGGEADTAHPIPIPSLHCPLKSQPHSILVLSRSSPPIRRPTLQAVSGRSVGFQPYFDRIMFLPAVDITRTKEEGGTSHRASSHPLSRTSGMTLETSAPACGS